MFPFDRAWHASIRFVPVNDGALGFLFVSVSPVSAGSTFIRIIVAFNGDRARWLELFQLRIAVGLHRGEPGLIGRIVVNAPVMSYSPTLCTSGARASKEVRVVLSFAFSTLSLGACLGVNEEFPSGFLAGYVRRAMRANTKSFGAHRTRFPMAFVFSGVYCGIATVVTPPWPNFSFFPSRSAGLRRH